MTSRLRQAVFVVTVALIAASCGGGEAAERTELTYSTYFDVFSFEYDAASSLDELAERSSIVTTATLTDVIDGPIFAASRDDPAASRFALFEFTSPDLHEPLLVRLPRPNTSDIDQIRSVMPIGAPAVLYLRPLPEIPEAERQLWIDVPDDRPLWFPTTPQGFILAIPNAGGGAEIDVPIHHERGGLIDAPDAGAPLSSWLPSGGPVIPAEYAASS